MKSFIQVLVCSIFFSCAAGDKENTKKGTALTEAEVRDFVRSYDEMWARRDTNSMKKAMAEDYIYFSSTGSTIDRTRILSWFTPAFNLKMDTAVRDQVKIVLNGNTAVVSTHWVGNGTINGEKFADDQRCSIIIQKINGELKVITEHCTQIAPR